MAKLKHVQKRDGRLVPFDESKIADAIFKAAQAVGGEDRLLAEELASVVTLFLEKNFSDGQVGNSPSIEEIQDMVEKVLIETGHAKTAKAYILYRDKRAKTRGTLRVRKEVRQNFLFDDIAPLVDAAARDELAAWSKGKIIAALEKEADIAPEVASEIAAEVERKVFVSGIERISTSLIRALVDNELFERGFGAKLQDQTLIGMPKYDLDELIFASDESGLEPAPGPNCINLAIAKNALKQYALQEIFSRDVADAHRRGMIHIHALDQPAHLHRSCWSMEFLKNHCVSRDSNAPASAGPHGGAQSGSDETTSGQAGQATAFRYAAPDAETLVGRAIAVCVFQRQYCVDYTGLDCVNTSLAPYLVDHSDSEMRVIAKRLIWGSQNAPWEAGISERGNGPTPPQPMLSIYTAAPSFMAGLPAVGPGGRETGKTYADYADVSLRLADAFVEAFREVVGPSPLCSGGIAGRTQGRALSADMPRLWVHCTEESFDDSSGPSANISETAVLKRACKLATDGVAVGFVIDRDDFSIFGPPPLRIPIQDGYVLAQPESMRLFSLQNVSLNLPQAAYRARRERQGGFRPASPGTAASGGSIETLASDIEAIYPEIDKAVELAVKAHVEKRMFLSKLMLPDRPLCELAKDAADGRPFVDLNKSACLIDIVGLNEALVYLTGRELHDGGEILKLGVRLASYIYFKVKEEAKRQGLRVFLNDLPNAGGWQPSPSGEGDAAARLARIDAKDFPDIKKAFEPSLHGDGDLQRGTIESGVRRYSNGFHLGRSAPSQSESPSQDALSAVLSRVGAEGRFHAMVESGAAIVVLSHEELSELCHDGCSPEEGVFKLVQRTLLETQVSQLVVSVSS